MESVQDNPYEQARGGTKSLRAVGRMLKVDVAEIHASESYQQTQAMTDQIINKHR